MVYITIQEIAYLSVLIRGHANQRVQDNLPFLSADPMQI